MEVKEPNDSLGRDEVERSKVGIMRALVLREDPSAKALECLVRLASVRRSLFTNEGTRLEFLAQIMTGTKEILQTGTGLADHDNYHVYCCLLGRLKVNYPLSELVNVEGYSDWIRLVAEFTLKSLQSWQWASDSVYYLLGLWSRLVTSIPYVKSEKPILIAEYVPKIIEGFVSSKFNILELELEDELLENLPPQQLLSILPSALQITLLYFQKCWKLSLRLFYLKTGVTCGL